MYICMYVRSYVRRYVRTYVRTYVRMYVRIQNGSTLAALQEFEALGISPMTCPGYGSVLSV